MRGLSYINMGGSDFALLNGASQILRRIDQSSWSKIRIGLRCAIAPFSAITLDGAPRFFVGMCNYNKGGVGSRNSNVHFVGTAQRSATVTVNGASPTSYNFGMGTCTRIAQVFSNGTGNSSLIPASPITSRGAYMVDIDKTNPSSTFIKQFRATSTTANFAVTQEQFFEQMEAATPSLSNYTFTTYGPVAVNEATNGALDAINVCWDRSQSPIWVYDLAWSILM